MSFHAHMVTVEVPGIDGVIPYVVVAEDKDEARDIIQQRFGATTDEVVRHRAEWSDDVAKASGIDLERHGIFSKFYFDWIPK